MITDATSFAVNICSPLHNPGLDSEYHCSRRQAWHKGRNLTAETHLPNNRTTVPISQHFLALVAHAALPKVPVHQRPATGKSRSAILRYSCCEEARMSPALVTPKLHRPYEVEIPGDHRRFRSLAGPQRDAHVEYGRHVQPLSHSRWSKAVHPLWLRRGTGCQRRRLPSRAWSNMMLSP